ncbi:prolyl 4-hydroxylase subunit alpha-1-like isoform X1 [Drosophila novamexicana]|uniref:prolyl 4-hydroxylase subunit alpha-1-like isoform X1 n=1 Tax=Drosophila novamexicana TaxID=47314 RepID=UPI0011E5FFBF|nr:prolyl 4-hydroxylase subunit alpha-1-like isoform X1 [Drosophila novamexicana]
MLQLTILRSVLNILGFAAVVVQGETSESARSYVTCMTDKLHLLAMERQLMVNLHEYIDKLQEKVHTLRRLAEVLESSLQAAEGREQEFLSNPLHTYTLIRHMHADWIQLERSMQQPVGQEQIDFIKEMQPELPLHSDLMEVTAAMHRVQQTYEMEPADMSKGLLDGVQLNASLSILDCYEMGALLFRAAEFEDASKWLRTARQLWNQSQSDLYVLLNVSRSDISSLLARSLIANGNFVHARDLLIEEPELWARKEEFFAEYWNHRKSAGDIDRYIGRLEEPFAKLCGSSHNPKPTQLTCYYKTNPSEFLRLAPFKMELLSKDPYVVVFHDVIYDSEIAGLIRVGEPTLKRTAVQNITQNVDTYISKDRTATGSWLLNGNLTKLERNMIWRIQKRIEDMTGLLITGFSEQDLQLLNYVFGGHYQLHYDFFNCPAFPHDRIATTLIYLNDVAKGGATVFPRLDLVVQPERGKVLHWYNMLPATFDYDRRSLHGGCPVLIGEKLALTNWIYEWDQIFRKPCLQPPVNRTYYFDVTD